MFQITGNYGKRREQDNWSPAFIEQIDSGFHMSAGHLPFQTAPWLSSAHMQTLWSPLFRRQEIPERHRERLELADGDFINLDWFGPEDGKKPLTILLHGLTGCSQSKYIVGLQRALAGEGLPSVAMNFRGCGGEPNNLTVGYHSGISSDLKLVLNELSSRFPGRTLRAVGYSLGGNVLLKYQGENGGKSLLDAAVAVSVPFELDQCSRRIDQGFSRVYRNRFMQELKEYVAVKKEHFRKHDWHDRLKTMDELGCVENLTTFYEYDDQVTAPLHGYSSAEDYYRKCSSRGFLGHITKPTLILQASDDPFLFTYSVPEQDELSSSTQMELSSGGGHVGFISSDGLKPVYWLEQRIPQFLRGYP
ncbi:hydrolase [Sansalvadorimonas sp. 2012CJ34-2]|uniref:Hydrolase n=1 Tax=Parendozoicomonas callyspongiae TaxID=2942213 RepID=A0ABT0PHJ1_9GAMM|nr:hydrolase [Sansalvadorimonas sp. 2012CJ34-2]MCL6270845.1 hydrolase [Sansalvadorimonas sp. 2012CJ34-2]